MNKQIRLVSVAAALGAALVLASAPASAGKPTKPGGGGSDPCAAAGLDFPAFTYWQQSGKGQQIFVADAMGKCSRPVYKTSGGSGNVGVGAFSYPVAGQPPNTGRIIWPENGAIYKLDFVVVGSTITIQEKSLIFNGSVLAMDLSADGTTLYIALNTDGPQIVQTLTIDGGGGPTGFYAGDPGSYFLRIAVNAAGTALFADQWLSFPNNGHRVLRIASTCANESCAKILAANPDGTSAGMFPAPSFVDPFLVYSDYLPGSNNCWLLQVIPETGGSVVTSSQPRYGTWSTWYGNQILTNGRNPPDGSGRCADTGFITQIDPATGAQTQLVRGYDPDGR